MYGNLNETSILENKEKCWKLPDSKIKLTTEELVSYIKDNYKDLNNVEYELVIGTDSQIRGRSFHFVTVVCIRKIGKGALYFYNLEIQSVKNFPLGQQKKRMFDEVAKAIEVAQHIEEKTKFKPIIHVDASPPSKKAFTSAFSDQLHGYVTSCGFVCMRKPESWASSSIGDRHCKQRYKRKK